MRNKVQPFHRIYTGTRLVCPIFFWVTFSAAIFLCTTSDQELQKKNPDVKLMLALFCSVRNLPHDVVFATVDLESNWDPECVEVQDGKKISFGLFQVSVALYHLYRERRLFPKVTDKEAERHLLDPYLNAEVGTWLMRWRLDRGYSIQRALSSHNLGDDGAIDYYRKNGRHRQSYLELIEARRGRYRSIVPAGVSVTAPLVR